MESKARKLCITQSFTQGVKGLTNSTTVKYCSTAFQWMVTLRVLSIESKVRKLCITQAFTLGVKGWTFQMFFTRCLVHLFPDFTRLLAHIKRVLVEPWIEVCLQGAWGEEVVQPHAWGPYPDSLGRSRGKDTRVLVEICQSGKGSSSLLGNARHQEQSCCYDYDIWLSLQRYTVRRRNLYLHTA